MKVKILILIAVLAFGYFFNVAKAQESSFSEEAIINYNSIVTVNSDNSIAVRETITYNTGPIERHGIYRDIYTFSSQKKKMSIDNIIVTDENNNPYQFQISNQGDYVRIKIGDPNQTFSGQKIYIIEYQATKAVAQFKDFDEIYWNVTGNDWAMPIYEARASVVLPYGTKSTQESCYYGKKGSTEQCEVSNTSIDSVYTFNNPSALGQYEGLTIAVGFPKGIVTPYSSSDNVTDFWSMYWRWVVSGLLPILTFIFSLWYWYKKGRDPKGSGVIVAQYDVPDNLTPMEAGGIVNEKVDVKYISAEIIYLATKGYLKIEQLEDKFIGFIKTTDYKLIKLKEPDDLPNDFDKNLLEALFTNRSLYNNLLKSNILEKIPKSLASILEKDDIEANKENAVKLSDLKNHFYTEISDIRDEVLDSLLNKNYYKNLGRMKNTGSRIAIILFMAVWASGFFGTLIGGLAMRGNPLPTILAIFMSIIIYGIISYFNPAKTPKGVATKEYLLGLKDYLQIAEKDRLHFHNAPNKRPEIFEKLLPFAMVLDVADIWAKEFEGIYTTPPSWYSGAPNTAFSAIAFNHSLSNFSSFASSSLSSSPGGSGGSGGGGSSGGGGGGGGGGGW